ncbi:Alkyl hydroperoxide reductase subunit C [bacterium HR39]|nr:Alkyl hydroperoxide reductase subunit C [bacterium HR39]
MSGVVRVGDAFPKFELPAYFPAEKRDGVLKLEDVTGAGKWLVMVYYPADFTFVCPTELADYARLYDGFRGQEAEVVGVSTDTVFTHKAWLETEKLLRDVRYPLAADHTGTLARQLGIYNEEDGTTLRGTFVVDPDGVLRAVEITWYDVGRNAAETLRQLEAFRYVRAHPGVACPAGWQPGSRVLRPSIDIAGHVAEALEG